MLSREFEPGDQTAVRDLVLAGLRDRWGSAFDPTFNPDVDDIIANYVKRGGHVVVIESDGRIVATGTLVPEPADRGRLLRISVEKSHQRAGFGRRVVFDLLEQARRRGMVEVVVKTDNPWTSAIELYRSCGFTEVDRDAVDTHFALQLDPIMNPGSDAGRLT